MTTRIRTQFDVDPDPGISDFGPSLARQEFLEESDINNIINQYETNGVIPDQVEGLRYGDFTDPVFTDYQHAQNIVVEAGTLFERIPAKVRERFSNDPASIIEFVQDPTNYDEALKLGLVNERPKAPVAPPAAEPPAQVTK